MKIQSHRRFNAGDYPTLNDDGRKLLETLNDILDGIVTCLQGSVSHPDQFNCEERTIQLAHNTDTNVKLKLNGKVRDVHVMWSELYDCYKLVWKTVSEDTITLKILWDSAPSAKYDVTLRFLGG